MSALHSKQGGMNLLEIMLVLAIASSITLMGINQYTQFKKESDVQMVRANVDKLFQAASYFYRANCRLATTMAPTASYTPQNPYPVNITTNLVNKGYLTSTVALNPLIDDTAGGNWAGYVVQFNSAPSAQTRNVCADQACATTTPVPIGQTQVWTTQVSIKVKDTTMAASYANMMGASCVSSEAVISGNTTVANCALAGNFPGACTSLRAIAALPPPFNGNAASTADNLGCPTTITATSFNNYVVFEQLPSYTSAASPPPGLWLTNPTVEQFTQLYNTYNIPTLTTSTHTPEYQYFVCGS